MSKLDYIDQMLLEEDIEGFEEMVWKLAASKENNVLDDLISLFDDNCEFPEVMYSVVHAIETYPDDAYVKGVLRNIKYLQNSPGWAKTLIYGILNSSSCRKLFVKNILMADLEALIILLGLIEKESPKHRTLVRSIITKTEQKSSKC